MIVGIDPGMRRLTLYSSEGMRDEVEVAKDERWNELRSLADYLRTALQNWNRMKTIQRIYCEEPVVAGARNIRTTIGIAETVGMVLSCGLPVTLVPVSSWKKEVIGNGSATKDQVREWYFGGHTPGVEITQDTCDAAAITEYGVRDMDRARRLSDGGLLTDS